VKVADVCRNRNDEVECVLVDDPLPDVEELRLQACNISGARISSPDHVTSKPEKAPGLSIKYLLKRNPHLK
jgi:hypothetical protein